MRMKRTQWQEVVDVNLTGVYLCSQVRPPHPRNLPSPTLPVNLHVHACDWSSTLPPPPGCSDADDEEEEGTRNKLPAQRAGRTFVAYATYLILANNLTHYSGKDHQHRIRLRDHRQRRAGQLLRRQGWGHRPHQGHGQGVRRQKHQCE